MPRAPKIPSYRLHKPSGQAVVTIRLPSGDRRDVYLGLFDSEESRREYGRVVAELATAAAAEQVADRAAPADISVNEVLIAFWRYAQEHYRRADGTPTHELMEYRQTFRPVRALYGHTPAREFGPLALKAVRRDMVSRGWCRRLVNQRVGRVKRVFKWAASEELIPVSVYQVVATVAGLQKGRTEAHETQPVGPVAPEHVRAVLPFLRPQVQGMVELQMRTGMRPGEVCAVRPCDLDTTGAVWSYRPPHHKLGYAGKTRVVQIGPQAQAILEEFRPPSPTDYFFSPRRAVEQLHAERGIARRTPRYPSHMARSGTKRVAVTRRGPGARYTATSYGQAIGRAIERANWALVEAAVEVEFHIPHWHPNQLRHAHATEVRRRFGLEAAQVVLGHERADVTQVYAAKNLALAARVAAEIG